MTERIVSAIVTFCGLATLHGCFEMIPIPSKSQRGARDNITEHAGDAFLPGTSTREDVLLTLGEPVLMAQDGSWLVFSDVHNDGHWMTIFGQTLVAETNDTIRSRDINVFFDSRGRVREVWFEEGNGFSSMPQGRLLDARFKSLAEPGEIIRAHFLGAAWRVAGRWTRGAMAATDRKLVFFEVTDTGPLFRLALRLPKDDFTSIELQKSDPFVLIRRTSGRPEAFAFTTLPRSGEALTFEALSSEHIQTIVEPDGVRARQFIEAVRRMGSQGRH